MDASLIEVNKVSPPISFLMIFNFSAVSAGRMLVDNGNAPGLISFCHYQKVTTPLPSMSRCYLYCITLQCTCFSFLNTFLLAPRDTALSSVAIAAILQIRMALWVSLKKTIPLPNKPEPEPTPRLTLLSTFLGCNNTWSLLDHCCSRCKFSVVACMCSTTPKRMLIWLSSSHFCGRCTAGRAAAGRAGLEAGRLWEREPEPTLRARGVRARPGRAGDLVALDRPDWEKMGAGQCGLGGLGVWAGENGARDRPGLGERVGRAGVAGQRAGEVGARLGGPGQCGQNRLHYTDEEHFNLILMLSHTLNSTLISIDSTVVHLHFSTVFIDGLLFYRI
ncbi:hypothetical protein KSS87_022396 [Heliosperma pusillum]|nr:hypothetical protein KSS87_022396 [Heliosperma pusillum]